MNLYLKFIVLWIIIPVVSLHQHQIYLSDDLPITKCQQINATVYQCGSITELFQQLSSCCNSTDIYIEPGNYNLALSYVIADLHDIRIRSETKAVIQCAANVNGTYDFDTGITFLRVTNLVITNISIVGCGMKHVSTNHIGAGRFIIVRSAVFIQNSTDISLDNITISESNEIGLLVYDTNGSVSITKSSFINNDLNSSEQRKLFTGGGGIYIEFTECTPGLTQCDSTNNDFNKLTKYTIDQCVFEDNAAIYHLNGSEPEDLAGEVFITFGTGGGLSLWLYGHAQNNSFQITSTHFISNKALYGGGLNVHSRQYTKYNSVLITWCSFIGNTGDVGGGGFTLGYVIYQTGGQSLFNTYIIANCLFQKNQALVGVGGGIVGFGSREPRRTQPTNHFEIYNSSFIGNGAQYGSAIPINKEYFDSITVGTIFTLVLGNCTFTNNNLNENYSSSVGAVAMSGVNLEFRGSYMFSNNNSTALIVDGASAKFGNDSLTTFQDNSGLHGGAISLINGAWISVYPNSNLIFLRNTAIQYGGAIYVSLTTPFDYLLSHVCFTRYYLENISPDEWKANFTFINNTGGNSNNTSTIFANTLCPCSKVYSGENNLLYNNNSFHHYSSTTNSVVSTSPATFIFLNQANTTFNIVPGEIFDLPVQLLDELGQRVSFAMFIATCSKPSSTYVLSPNHFTNGSIQIAGKPNDICQL